MAHFPEITGGADFLIPGSVDGFNDKLDPPSLAYRNRISAKGGVISAPSLQLARILLSKLATTGLLGKIKYLGGGLFGENLATSLIPVINETGVSAADQATAVNLDNSHYTERGVGGGIQKNPNTDGYFDTSVPGSAGDAYAYYYDEAFNFYRLIEPTVGSGDNYFGLADNTGSGTPGNFTGMRLMAFVVADGLSSGEEATLTEILDGILR